MSDSLEVSCTVCLKSFDILYELPFWYEENENSALAFEVSIYATTSIPLCQCTIFQFVGALCALPEAPVALSSMIISSSSSSDIIQLFKENPELLTLAAI